MQVWNIQQFRLEKQNKANLMKNTWRTSTDGVFEFEIFDGITWSWAFKATQENHCPS